MYRDTVFRKKETLFPDYIPDHLPSRGKELDSIGSLIESGLKSRPTNISIRGDAGTGKTACVKHLFERMEEKTPALPFYVNCFRKSSRSGVIYELITTIFRKAGPTRRMPSRRGVAYDELWDSFREEMEKKRVKAVICLDEVDQLSKDGSKVLYDLSRFNRERSKIQLILVSNQQMPLMGLDSRIKSSLRPMEEIHFDRYGFREMKEIIESRVKAAFWKEVVSEEAVDFLAEFTVHEGGDVRIARETLLRAGEELSDKGKSEMEVEDLQKVIDSSKFAKKLQILKRLDRRRKQILRMIPRDGIFFPQLSRMYQSEKGDIGERRLRQHVDELEELNLLNMNREGLNGSYKITLNVPRRILFEVS